MAGGACMAVGLCVVGGMSGKGYVWQRGHAWYGCAWQGDVRGRREDHCSGIYFVEFIHLFQPHGLPVRVHHVTTEPLASTSTSIHSSVSAEMDTLELNAPTVSI